MKRSRKTPEKTNKKKNVGKQIPENGIKKTKIDNFLNIWTLSATIIIIGFFAFSKYLTGEYLFFFKDIGSDSINQNYPAIVHKINLLKEGFISKWSFYKGTGDRYTTRISSEPYGLLRQGIDFIGATVSGENFFIYGRFLRIFIFYFLFTGIIAFLYFRTLNFKKYVSFTGALLISFSGYAVAGAGWDFSSHIFKAMFMLFAFEQLYLKKRWYFFPFAVIWLSSNPYVLYVYAVFLFLYSLFRYFSEEKNKISGYLKLTGKMILLGLTGIMMNFASVLSSFLKMYNSPRVAGNASYEKMLNSGKDIVEHGNLAGTTVFRFFSNDILGNGSNFHGWFNYLEAPLFYIGLITLLLFPQVFIHLNKRKKIVFGTFLGFWLLTLFFPYLRYTLLAFTGDYFRYGFDFFIPFTLLFFAVFSLNELLSNRKINTALLSATLVFLIILLYIPYENISSVYINENIRKTVVFLLILYFAFILIFSKTKFKTISKAGILLLTIFELSYFSYQSYAGRVPVTKTEFNKDKAGYADGTIKAVKYIKSIDKTPFFRTEKDYQSGNAIHGSLNDALAQNYYGTTSYSSFNQLNYVRFLEETGLIIKGDETATRWITGFRSYPLLLTFGNVKYFLSKSENPEFLKFGFDKIAKKNGITILKNRFHLPFGYTYDKYIDFEVYQKLINYRISVQSLNLIYQDLSRTVDAENLNEIIKALKPLLTKKFDNLQSFSDAVKNKIGKENEKYVLTIAKYSVDNFKNQIALLNAFVYEKKSDKNLKLSEFQKISLQDTSVILPPEKFNFEIYKKITDSLKQDTFQITSFKQSEITGKISLPKTKMLFFTIPYDKGWHIEVNGKDEKLQRVNIGFTGIILPKGEYEIKLFYIPEYYSIANTITRVSVILFWAYLLFFFYRKNKPGHIGLRLSKFLKTWKVLSF